MLAVAPRAMRGERRAFDAPGQLLASQLSAEMLFNPFGKLQFGATPHRQACLLQRSTDDMLHNALPRGTSHLRHALVKAALLLSFFKHVASLANHDCARSLLRGFSKCARHTDEQKTRTLAEPGHAHKACAHSAQRPSHLVERARKGPRRTTRLASNYPPLVRVTLNPKQPLLHPQTQRNGTSINTCWTFIYLSMCQFFWLVTWHWAHQTCYLPHYLLDLYVPVHVPIFWLVTWHWAHQTCYLPDYTESARLGSSACDPPICSCHAIKGLEQAAITRVCSRRNATKYSTSARICSELVGV